jgi:hypothetical protein
VKEIRIPIPIAVLAIIAATVAAIVAQLPEIERYLKLKTM